MESVREWRGIKVARVAVFCLALPALGTVPMTVFCAGDATDDGGDDDDDDDGDDAPLAIADAVLC